MSFGAEKNVEYKVSLGRALQAFLLDMFEEDFLLFCHVIPVALLGFGLLGWILPSSDRQRDRGRPARIECVARTCRHGQSSLDLDTNPANDPVLKPLHISASIVLDFSMPGPRP